MDLYGSTTSPFVRRVRIVALETATPFNFVDVNASADGWDRVRALTPVGKIPTMRFDDGTVAWDSRVIIDALCRTSWAPLRAPPSSLQERVDEENVVNAVDEALLALIRLFYVKKDGGLTDVAWYRKESQRAETILVWVATRVREGRYVGAFGAGQGFGLAEIATVTALGWIRFRNMATIEKWPSLAAFEQAWASRESVASTAPKL